MKFALFSHIAWPEGTNQRQIIEQTTEEVQHGESLGFHSAWFAEHHFSRYGIGSSSLMIAGARRDSSPDQDDPTGNRRAGPTTA